MWAPSLCRSWRDQRIPEAALAPRRCQQTCLLKLSLSLAYGDCNAQTDSRDKRKTERRSKDHASSSPGRGHQGSELTLTSRGDTDGDGEARQERFDERRHEQHADLPPEQAEEAKPLYEPRDGQKLCPGP